MFLANDLARGVGTSTLTYSPYGCPDDYPDASRQSLAS